MSHNNDLVQTTKYYIYTAHTIYDDDKPFIEQFATKADALAKLEWYITNEIDMFNNPPKEVLAEGYVHCKPVKFTKKSFRDMRGRTYQQCLDEGVFDALSCMTEYRLVKEQE